MDRFRHAIDGPERDRIAGSKSNAYSSFAKSSSTILIGVHQVVKRPNGGKKGFRSINLDRLSGTRENVGNDRQRVLIYDSSFVSRNNKGNDDKGNEGVANRAGKV